MFATGEDFKSSGFIVLAFQGFFFFFVITLIKKLSQRGFDWNIFFHSTND